MYNKTNMKQRKIWQTLFVAATITASITGCKKDENPTNNDFTGNGTFIICEGGYGAGNARLDFYHKTGDSLQTNIFQKVNGIPLGDIFQSMLINNDRAFLVVNNSGKIEVVDPKDMTSKGTITGLTSPRYVCFTGNTKAYVSDLFSGNISIINTTNLNIESTISLPGWSEEMLNDNGKIWVTNGMKDYTYILQNNAVVDSVNVGYGSTSIRKDNSGKIWILTGGNYPPNTINSKISRVNPTTNAVEWDYEFASFGASKLRTNADKSVLYFLYDGKVYRKNADNSTPSEFISLTGKQFYGMNVDPSNGNIWLGDAGDFSSAGTVYVYNSASTQLKSFTTGVAPTDFVF